ncbi:MAG TPA: SAM-dependent methyltransferase [Gaiellaceae bacterium]|nr:SAM-dependent methyltransferase [Gaiellaceae bacterium]
MTRNGRPRLRALADLLADAHPGIDTAEAIGNGRVLVDGGVATNPASLFRGDAAITLRPEGEEPLRGEAKLTGALEAFAVEVDGRVALDLGAAAGGFTRVLLRAGAARVYAVDAGHGQLLGSLRQHRAVVNLERTNLGELSTALVPDPIDLVTADLSYISLARAIPQLDGRVTLTSGADLVALVKPMFELSLPEPPTDRAALAEAVERAATGLEAAGWEIRGTCASPVTGTRGSVEFLLHARRGV